MLINYIIVVVLVTLSGIFSGLTLGYFSMDLTGLERKIKLGDTRAKKIYPIRKRGNLLLCTLLLGNVATNSTMAIFLGDIASGVMAGLISTSLIVIFGEILPQAFFSRYALTVGAYSVGIIKLFIFLLYPIAFPLSWCLDKILGEELPTVWNKQEIQEIIKAHEGHHESEIDEDEGRIIMGALSFSERVARDIMTPKTVVFHLEKTTILDIEQLNKIKTSGFSRIPILENDKVLGILYTKDLIGLTDFTKTVEDFLREQDLISVKESLKLDNLLNHFINKKKIIAIAYNDYGTYTGIVTLEDVIEEIIRVEIIDEDDISTDMQELALKKLRKDIIDN